MTMNTLRTRLAIPVALLAVTSACSSTYYGMRGALGDEKRDIVAERVVKARDTSAEAKLQVNSTLEAFRTLAEAHPGSLDATYTRLAREASDSEDLANELSRRIEAVEEVATRMFTEWSTETVEFSDSELRRRSQDMRATTRDQYDEMITQLRNAESAMRPVVASFDDRVRLMRHNLNAQGIGDLRGEADAIEDDVRQVMDELDRAVDEADRFLTALGERSAASQEEQQPSDAGQAEREG